MDEINKNKLVEIIKTSADKKFRDNIGSFEANLVERMEGKNNVDAFIECFACLYTESYHAVKEVLLDVLSQL